MRTCRPVHFKFTAEAVWKKCWPVPRTIWLIAALNTKSGRLCDKARKDLSHTFNELGLSSYALTNQKSTNFLDVTFNFTNGTYKPYRKPNDSHFI